jgi:hypothetical protein
MGVLASLWCKVTEDVVMSVASHCSSKKVIDLEGLTGCRVIDGGEAGGTDQLHYIHHFTFITSLSPNRMD